MTATLTCDKCYVEIRDGVEVVAHYLDLKQGQTRQTLDYCADCANECIMQIIKAPKFRNMLVTKIGIHFDYE